MTASVWMVGKGTQEERGGGVGADDCMIVQGDNDTGPSTGQEKTKTKTKQKP